VGLAVKRMLVPLALVAAAAIVGGGLALVLAARGGEDDRPGLRATMRVASAQIRPSVSAFGEPVVAEVTLVGDRALIAAPESVRIISDFSPYETARPVQVERTETGDSLRWRFRYTLRCLREGCAPDDATRTFDFPTAAVVYRRRTSTGPLTAIFDWPNVDVTARVAGDALAPQAWRADLSSVPQVSYSWSPGLLAVTLFAGSIVFAGLGVGIASWLVRGRERDEEDEQTTDEPVQTPLERALELARSEARNGDSPERRQALERVARELGSRGLPDLAERARTLAWASGTSDPAEVDDLARNVRAATNGGTA
jgi:hypothetical protein